MPSVLSTVLVVGALAMVCQHGSAVRVSMEEEDFAFTPPPVGAIEKGLEVAQAHITAKEKESAEAVKAATDLVTHAQNMMMEALKSNDITKSKEAMAKFETALAAKAKAEKAAADAKELHNMVQTHNAKVTHFFDAIDAFQRNQVSRDASRAAYWAENYHEVVDLLGLTDVFGEMMVGQKSIQTKDQEMGNVGVYTAVHEGLLAVQNWANGETQKVCQKYMHAPGPVLTQERLKVEAAAPKGGANCRNLIKVLVEKFSGGLSPEM